MMARDSLPTAALKFSAFAWLMIWYGCAPPEDASPRRVIEGSRIWNARQEVNTKDSSPECVMNFAVGPWQSPEIMERSYQPLLGYLSQKLHCKFVLNVSPDYPTLRRDLRDGNTQIVDFDAGTYAEALQTMSSGMKYVATVSKQSGGENRDYYNGYLFSRRDSGIKSLEQIRGKNVGFVDRSSSSGYKYPLANLLKQNIDPKTFFNRTFFLGSHDKVTDAVAAGNIDAGATWDGNFRLAVEKHGDIFHIIEKTPPIPFDAWVTSKTISDDFIEKLRHVLVNLPANAKNSSGQSVYGDHFPFTGFVGSRNALPRTDLVNINATGINPGC